MAKLLFTPLVYDLRGKVGDYVYKRHPYSKQTVLEPKIKQWYDYKISDTARIQQENFKLADKIWREESEAFRQIWRDAVKKHALTGYMLWMKETLFCFNTGDKAPDAPSISGGFSTRTVKPGTKYDPVNPRPPCPPPVPDVLVLRVGAAPRGGNMYDMTATLNGGWVNYNKPGNDIQLCFGTMPWDHRCNPLNPAFPKAHFNLVLNHWTSMPYVGDGPVFTWIMGLFFPQVPYGCFYSHCPASGDVQGGFSVDVDWTPDHQQPCGFT